MFIIALIHDSAFILCLFFHLLHLGSKGGLLDTRDPLKLHADFYTSVFVYLQEDDQ